MEESSGRRFAVAIVLVLFVAGCAGRPPSHPPTGAALHGLRTQRPYQINGTWYYPLPSADGYVEEGIASWYGAEFNGKPTACGEAYNMYDLTAAHKTLPLGTHVKVTHLKNGRSCILRINDRGPFVAGRIIDLSCKAAQDLGVAQTGIAQVRVEAVQVASEQVIGQNTYWKPEPVPSFRYGLFTVQIGSFREQQNASRLKERMSRAYPQSQICLFNFRGASFYRVQVGSFEDLLAAQKELGQLKRQGFNDAFVIAMEGK